MKIDGAGLPDELQAQITLSFYGKIFLYAVSK